MSREGRAVGGSIGGRGWVGSRDFYSGIEHVKNQFHVFNLSIPQYLQKYATKLHCSSARVFLNVPDYQGSDGFGTNMSEVRCSFFLDPFE